MRWLVLVVAAVGCGPATPPPLAPGPSSAPPPSGVEYVFALDRALERMSVVVCFEGGRPDAMVPIHVDARERIRHAEARVGTVSRPLPFEREIDLRGLPLEACVAYEVDVAAGGRRGAAAGGSYRVGDDLVVPTSLWLWAPDRLRSDARIRARFELPPGVRASTVWPELSGDEGWLRLDTQAFRYLAYVAFGTFEVERVAVPGGCIEVAVLDGELGTDAAARARWLRAAGRAVSQLGGRFPAERAGVLVLPVPLADTPVLFGIVGRGMLPTIALLVGEDAEEDALVADWTAVHELTHLASPYVERDEAWLTEGLATYYQQVLRARAELIPAELAWTELVNGLARGRGEGTGRTLAEETRDMRSTHAYGRVYWAGAAIALLADVELRRAGSSLDDAMRRAFERRGETMTAAELVRAMDGEDGGVLARLMERWIGSSELPEVGPTLEWLGVRAGPRGVTLDPDAPGASVREAIVNDRREVASEPSTCEPRTSPRG